MADLPSGGMGPDREPPAGTPGWVVAFGMIALVLVLLVIVAFLIGGDHGPRRHTSSDVWPAWHVAGSLTASGAHPR